MAYAVGEGREDNLTFQLYPVVEKNVSVKKYVIRKSSAPSRWRVCWNSKWEFDPMPRRISENETVNIILTKVKTEKHPDELFASLTYNGSSPGKHQTIRLAPGKYKATIITTLYENITLPKQKKCKKGECATLPETSMYPYPEGMLSLNNETFYFDVSPEDLYGNNSLEFYALAYGLAEVNESCRRQTTDISPSPKIEEVARLKKALIHPKFR